MTRALLVDDHAFLREALALVMFQELPFTEVLQAGTLEEARDVLRVHADVALVLVRPALPDGDGVDALAQLRAATRAALVVMCRGDSPATLLAAIRTGADGFLPKSLPSACMLEALRLVLAGGVYLPADARDTAREVAGSAPDAAAPVEPLLSPRQVDVLRRLVEGKANKVISRELEMSESTVKTHLAAIFRKLDANTRTQAVVAATRLGFGGIDPASAG